MSTTRDSQKTKVYKAEASVYIKHSVTLSVAQCEALIERIRTDPRVVAKYRKRRAFYVEGGRRRGCAYSNGGITLGVWARQLMVVVHEMAHVMAGHGHGHDWVFCEIYIDLTSMFVNSAAAEQLKASFKDAGVKYKAPRTGRQMTPEQREAAKTRLAAARAVRKPTAPTAPKLSNFMIDELQCSIWQSTSDRKMTVRISPNQVANVHRALERRGLVELTPTSNHSSCRTFTVMPTDAGRKALNDYIEARNSSWAIAMAKTAMATS